MFRSILLRLPRALHANAGKGALITNQVGSLNRGKGQAGSAQRYVESLSRYEGVYSHLITTNSRYVLDITRTTLDTTRTIHDSLGHTTDEKEIDIKGHSFTHIYLVLHDQSQLLLDTNLHFALHSSLLRQPILQVGELTGMEEVFRDAENHSIQPRALLLPPPLETTRKIKSSSLIPEYRHQ